MPCSLTSLRISVTNPRSVIPSKEPPFTAREIAFLHQAQPLIAYAYASGAREQRVAEGGSPALLRQRQAEVAALAEQGLSNAEIARALNISPETVKRHLSTIYKQLRIRSRIELAARLAVPGSSEG